MSSDLEMLVRQRLQETVGSITVPTAEILQVVAQRVPAARRARRGRAIAASVVAAVAVTCAVAVVGLHHQARTASVTAATPGPSSPGVLAGSGCPGQDPHAVHEPAHLARIRAAYVCGYADSTQADGSVWWVSTVSRVTGGLDRLLAAYAVPDSPHTASNGGQRMLCASPAYLGGVVWLDTTNGIVGIHRPVGVCQVPLPRAVAAFEGLTTVLVSQRRVSLVSSPLAARSGCAQQAKDLLAISGTPATGGAPATITAGSDVLVCTYSITGGADPSLAAARTLSAAEVSAVDVALAASTPDPTCSRQAGHRFAVIQLGTQLAVWVSLDGCAVLDLNGKYWRATDQLRSLLR
jgi:hypothetical protein